MLLTKLRQAGPRGRIGGIELVAPMRSADFQRPGSQEAEGKRLHRTIRHDTHRSGLTVSTRWTGKVLRNHPGEVAPQKPAPFFIPAAGNPPPTAAVLREDAEARQRVRLNGKVPHFSPSGPIGRRREDQGERLDCRFPGFVVRFCAGHAGIRPDAGVDSQSAGRCISGEERHRGNRIDSVLPART